jgi:hypothetical protein
MTAQRAEPAAQDQARQEPESTIPPVLIGTGMPATTLLEAFGQWIYDAFGETAYQVGSSTKGKTWRDVDVRLMLDDDAFHALFPGYRAAHQRDAKWSLLCAAISELGKRLTGLPIDFQIQPATEANKRYGRPHEGHYRNPLWLYNHASVEAEKRRRAERETQTDGDAPPSAGLSGVSAQ